MMIKKISGSTVAIMDSWMWSDNLSGWLLPLLRAFEAEESGVSGEVVSAPSSKTWIWGHKIDSIKPY